MDETSKTKIQTLVREQKKFFSSNQTKEVDFRLTQLKKLKESIISYEDEITDALWTDLRKSYEETYLTEVSIVLQEIEYHIKNLKKWASPKKVRTPFYLLPSHSELIVEPLGTSLIIAPWNYPFQLLFNPLIGAISAGCCAVLKPSPDTPTVARVMEKIIKSTFKEEYIGVVQGGRKANEILLKEKFDCIFFTGSSKVGKVVMKAAAEFLTPVILELGGKSPCIVDKDADLETAAKRIIWGKTINAGQTCIAPDYLFVHESVKENLLTKMSQTIENMFGSDVQKSEYYPRIVNEEAFNRLTNLMNEGTIRFGGQTDPEDRFISPTIIDEVQPDSQLMNEEIFGPLLPVLTFSNIETALDYVNSNKKPLAFYFFGNSKKGRKVLSRTTSGGACINDTLMHISNKKLPFGGVGNSGIGKYHGKESFLAFSNKRSVVSTPTWIDIPFRYVPFRFFKLIKKLI